MSKEQFFGPVLRYFRKERGLSQDELAARVDVSRSHIGRLETGEKQPSLKMLFRLAEAMDVPASAVLAEMERFSAEKRGA